MPRGWVIDDSEYARPYLPEPVPYDAPRISANGRPCRDMINGRRPDRQRRDGHLPPSNARDGGHF